MDPTSSAPPPPPPPAQSPGPALAQPVRQAADLGAVVTALGAMPQIAPIKLRTSAGPMCVACGTSPATPTCAKCRWPVAHPLIPADSVLGNLYRLRRGIRRRWAICLSFDETTANLLVEDETETLAIPIADLREPETIPGGADLLGKVLSPWGRMLIIAEALRTQTLKSKLDPAMIEGHIATAAKVSTDVIRLIAIDACSLDRTDILQALPLGETEKAWYRAVTATRVGDTAALRGALGELHPTRYVKRIDLVASLAYAIPRGSEDARSLADALEGFVESEPAAAMLVHHLRGTDTSAATRLEGLRWLDSVVPLPPAIQEEVDEAISQIAGTAPPSAPTPTLGVGTRRLRAARGAAGALLPGDLRGAPATLVDNLIDRRIADRTVIDTEIDDEQLRSYFIARLDPSDLSDAQLHAIGHHSELARRAYLAHDSPALGRLPDSAGRRLYETLFTIRAGKVPELDPAERAQMRDPIPALIDVLVKAKESHEQAIAAVTPEVAADASLWRPLADVVGVEEMLAAWPIADGPKDLHAWLCVQQAQEKLMEGRFLETERTIAPLIDALPPASKLQALNLLASSLLETGRPQEAVRSLDAAIAIVDLVDLRVNAALAAEGISRELAGDHLARVANLAPDEPVRIAATMRLLNLWGTDSTPWIGQGDDRYPDVLRDPVRRALVSNTDIETFRELLSSAYIRDATFVADPRNFNGSPHQGSLELRYYGARASGDLKPIVDIMATVTDWSTTPRWFSKEKESWVESIIEFLIDHLNDAEVVGPGLFALDIADRVRDLDPDDVIILRLAGICAITYDLNEREAPADPSLFATLHGTRKVVPTVTEHRRGAAEALLELAIRRCAINVIMAYKQPYLELVQEYNRAVEIRRVAPYGSAAFLQAQSSMGRSLSFYPPYIQALEEWVGIVEDPDVRQDLKEKIAEARDNLQIAQRALQR